MTSESLRQQAIEASAESIDDLLTMLGVDPAERQVEDVHGADTPIGDDVKTILSRAVVAAAEPFLRQLVVTEIAQWIDDGGTEFGPTGPDHDTADAIRDRFGGES